MNILKALFYRRFETFSPQWRHEQYLRQLNICFLEDQYEAQVQESDRIQKIIDSHKKGENDDH